MIKRKPTNKRNRLSNVLWVDDELTDRHFEPLSKYFNVTLVDNAKEGLKLLSENSITFDCIVTDLKMKTHDGFWFINKLDTINKNRTLVCSAYLNSEPYKNQLKAIGITEERQIKLESVVEFESEQLEELVVRKIKRQGEYANNYAFELSSNEFYELSSDEKKELNELVYLNHKKELDKYFSETKHTWVLLAKGKVLKSGKESPPDSSTVFELSKEQNTPIYRYFRGDISEEIFTISANSGFKWSYYTLKTKNPGNYTGYYPSIEVFIPNDDHDKSLLGDFDTGTIFNFVDFNYLISLMSESEKNNRKKIYNPGPSSVNGNPIYYDIFIIPIFINTFQHDGSNKSICIKLTFRCVDRWDKSWFTSIYKKRKALFGRELLEANKLVIVLDGKNNKTHIKCEE